jgi:hypothetical protein
VRYEISAGDVRQWIQQKGQPANEQLFLEKFVLPAIPKYLGQALDPPAIDEGDKRICEAFLAESSKAKRESLTSDSPRSAKKYLFTKVWANPKHVVASWWQPSKKGPTSQSCPDWAFRGPCPYRVVFEGKLFRSGETEHARAELVSGIYQCFYYRAHPELRETKTHPPWKYDYACLFAYDSSEKQTLVEAWKSLKNEVKKACWDSANIFVMVLPAEQK